MAYVGNVPARSFISFERQVFTIVNSQTAYTLSHSVTNENDIRLVINNIVQEPGSGKAYTASGTTLTLSAALTNGTDEMYCVFLGRAIGTVNAPAGSVGTSQLASEAVTDAKVASSIITGQTAETTIATDDLILLSDTSASGALKKMTRANFVSGVGGTNTPSFYSQMSANQSYSSSGAIVKVQFDTELWDTDSDYDHSTNYRFTPSEAGKYFVHGIVYSATFANASMAGGAVYIKKNGGNYQGSAGNNSHNTPDFQAVGIPFGIAVDMNGSSDYIECFVQLTFSSGTCNIQHDNNGKASYFGAYKLIGV